MKRFCTLSFLLCLAVMSTAWAGPISENQARVIANNFLASKAIPTSGLKAVHRVPKLGGTSSSSGTAYYVFNNSRPQSGFVIIAGDDRAPAVLAYSDKGTFDAGNIPEAMQDILDGYTAQISALNQGSKAPQRVSVGVPIRPLVPAVWSQNAPYNTLLPILSNGKHAHAGCVATAAAQVMFYHKWPASTTIPIPAYQSETLHYNMPELPVTGFDWDIMHNTYQTTDTTSASALAAAKLTLYCAQSVEMDFKSSSSAATTAELPMALSTYFGYDASAHVINRINYTTQEWEQILYAELAASRPVIYSGRKLTGGHAFVCDGYDGSGLFHINWGWNGQSNGYFVLNVLNPDEQGTGSASGAYGYILEQAAIIGLQPGDAPSVFEVTTAEVSLDDFTTTRSKSSDPFTAYVSGKFYNYTSQVIALNLGWGLYQGETLKSVLSNSYNNSFHPGKYIPHSGRKLDFGSLITSGTYRIVPIYSERGAGNWRPCIGADKNYIEVTINGNTCTYEGFGTAADNEYTVEGIDVSGTMHPTRPIDITVQLTNNGYSRNQYLYMLANGTFTSAGYVSIENGASASIPFRFVPETAGTYTLTFSFNEDGSDPIATRTITVNAMPAANLSATAQLLNVTDANARIVTSDKFSVVLNITNNASTTYREDISIKLFKNTQGTSGSNVQAKNQYIELAPGASTTIQFDMDNVVDGWRYFAKTYYYSEGEQVSLVNISTHTIIFPEQPQFIPGDVNGDNEVDVSDVSMTISFVLGNLNSTIFNELAADVNGDYNVDVSDISLMIRIALGLD